MTVMFEVVIGKNPNQSVSQINLPLDTMLAVSVLICWFFSWGKRDQVRKDSTLVFEFWVIWALRSNINWFILTFYCLINFEVTFRGSGHWQYFCMIVHFLQCMWFIYLTTHVHAHTYMFVYIHTQFLQTVLHRNVRLFSFLLSSVSG